MPAAVEADLREPLLPRAERTTRGPFFLSSASMEATSIPSERRRLSLAQLIRRSSNPHAADEKVVNPLRADSMSSVSSESGVSSTKLYRNSTVRVKKSDHTIHQAAASKLQQLSTRYQSRKKLQLSEGVTLPWYIVHPHDIIAQFWWAFILCTVLVTAWWEPWGLAFTEHPGLYPPTSFDTVLSIVLMACYGTDILLTFFVAFYEEGQLVCNLKGIATHYARTRLPLDLLTTIPFDWIVLGAMGLQQSNSTTAWYISLLRLLRVGRMYRLYSYVLYLTYHQAVSLLLMTLVRNVVVVFYVVHWGGCIFYYIAKQSGFTNTTWVGAASDWIGNAGPWERYVYSLYWSIITFATVGYGDFHAYNVAEALFTFFYVFLSVILMAWIVGTITLLVVKSDEKTGQYRENLGNLDLFSHTHDVPEYLSHHMKDHLRLHFTSQEASDDKVLRGFPTTIRRRVLRHLYLQSLERCWLFQGCKQKFKDALLAAAKVELFMPNVEICTEGDHVNELHLLVAGEVVVEGQMGMGRSESVVLDMEGASVHGGRTRLLGPGDSIGEMAFFTEIPMLETARTTSVCRVLVINRLDYVALVGSFPISAKAVMDNLADRAEEMVRDEFPGPASEEILKDLDALAALSLKWASPELMGEPDKKRQLLRRSSGSRQQLVLVDEDTLTGGALSRQGTAPDARTGDGAQGPGWTHTGSRLTTRVDHPSLGYALKPHQQQALGNLMRVRAMVAQQGERLQQERVNEFLSAAAGGDVLKLQLMLQQGFDVDSADYDARTALMIAAGKGHLTAIKQLLVAGANPNLQDGLGSCALLEAAKGGHEDVIAVLQNAGAVMTLHPVMAAAHLCTAVFDGNLMLLKHLLMAGINANAADYDKRTALHIAAADSSLGAVRMLVEQGRADPDRQDRWEHTALEEAWRVGAHPVVEYLLPRMAEAAAAAAQGRLQERQAARMLTAASLGDTEAIALMLQRGCSPDITDYDRRSGLMLAAASGQEVALKMLLSAGANPNIRDNLGGCALQEAVKAGHMDLVKLLVEAGGQLCLSPGDLAGQLCSLVYDGNHQLLGRYIAAGADVNVGDYDARTALHIAAAEGKLDMVKLLVEQGGANPLVQDRWGNTPLAEATRVKALEVVAFLKQAAAP